MIQAGAHLIIFDQRCFLNLQSTNQDVIILGTYCKSDNVVNVSWNGQVNSPGSPYIIKPKPPSSYIRFEDSSGGTRFVSGLCIKEFVGDVSCTCADHATTFLQPNGKSTSQAC